MFGNHAGFNLLDGLMLTVGARLHSKSARHVRALFHIGSEKAPLFGPFLMNQLGAVIGHQQNIHYLLGKGEVVLTYPEGGKSTSKPYDKRRALCPPEEFGDGFIKAAIQSKVPLIPVATVGCEEALPTMFISEPLGKFFGFDQGKYPVTPQSFFTVPHSLMGVPLHCFNFLLGFPSKVRIKVGEPVSVSKNDDVASLKQKLYDRLQSMILELA